MPELIRLVEVTITIYSYLLLARVILSWVNASDANPWVRLLVRLTEPFLAPFRALIPSFGGMDFSPIVAFLVLSMLQRVLIRLLLGV